jgi:hypothetical protein
MGTSGKNSSPPVLFRKGRRRERKGPLKMALSRARSSGTVCWNSGDVTGKVVVRKSDNPCRIEEERREGNTIRVSCLFRMIGRKRG